MTRIDPSTAYAQIGKWALIRVGATNRMYGSDFVQFDMTLNRRKRTTVIQLNENDLYDIEVGRMHRKTFEWVSDYSATDIGAEQLSDIVETAFQRVMS